MYDRINVRLVHGTASEVHPDENYILAKKANSNNATRIDYDDLVLATGPRLNWEGTKGFGPTEVTRFLSAGLGLLYIQAKYIKYLDLMRRGERVEFVIGVGHPESTCQGAAFDFNGYPL